MNKLHHRQSYRLQNYDYGRAGAYFVTINAQNRTHYFGKIKNGMMCLNEIGTIAHQEWLKTAIIRSSSNIALGEFVVMPNHVHGVIIIGQNEHNETSKSNPKNEFGPQRKNLGSIMRGFKSAVTISARKINPKFGWHTRFHDHIIRNEKALNNIQNYIATNPRNWQKDKFYTQM